MTKEEVYKAIDGIVEAKKDLDVAKKRYDLWRIQLEQYFIDSQNEILMTDDVCITYMPVTSIGVDRNKLEEEFPAVFRAVRTTTEKKQLRVQLSSKARMKGPVGRRKP